MSRISAPLARKLDRLSRVAHRFHRWAHHPLCTEYAGELVQLGRRTRVCRGCLFVTMGALTGGLASLVAPRASVFVGVAALVASSGWLLWVVSKKRGTGLFPKVRSRFLPAAAMAFALGHLAYARASVFFAAAAGCALAVVLIVRAYRKRAPDRTPCASCPEREKAAPCRGFSKIVRRERAYRRLAGRLLAAESAREARFG